MKKLLMFLMAAALLATISYAQTPATEEHNQEHNRVFIQNETIHAGQGQGIGQGEGHGAGWVFEGPEGATAMAYAFAEIGGDRETVKGAPYTATAVTEITQSLADGNRIVNKTSSSVARDSQGRTRREETVGKVGGLQLKGLKVVSIYDPVAGTSFVFKSGGQPAEEEKHGEAKVIRIEERKKVRVFTSGTPKEFSFEHSGEVKHESLGTKTIEGVSAEGKRETRTIAAGAIGNERPIEITSETWYSPELHTVVLSKRNDPRMGETVFRLTEISRAEPDASLFQPPPGTKVESERRGKGLVIERHSPEEE
jgi:hypothetical protein